jgi:hypothetical protein
MTDLITLREKLELALEFHTFATIKKEKEVRKILTEMIGGLKAEEAKFDAWVESEGTESIKALHAGSKIEFDLKKIKEAIL